MQFCSFENVVNNGVDAELERLYDAKFITDFAYKNVYTDRIDLFFKSECFAELSEATDVYRELRFNVNLNASEFVEDEEKKNDLSGKKLLVQGVIDCLYITNDGKLKLLDYKTDNFVIRNEYDRADARKKLSTRYRLQMKYYAKAAEMIVCRPVDSINIYSFALNETVNMNDVISE